MLGGDRFHLRGDRLDSRDLGTGRGARFGGEASVLGRQPELERRRKVRSQHGLAFHPHVGRFERVVLAVAGELGATLRALDPERPHLDPDRALGPGGAAIGSLHRGERRVGVAQHRHDHVGAVDRLAGGREGRHVLDRGELVELRLGPIPGVHGGVGGGVAGHPLAHHAPRSEDRHGLYRHSFLSLRHRTGIYRDGSANGCKTHISGVSIRL
jgi:hypothetical protein